jgi:hypothetical protein
MTFLVMALSGCEAVFTRQPLGDEAVTLDPATWQGTWLSDEIVLLTTVLDSEKGQLQAAWIERGAKGAKFEVVTGTIRQSGGIMFLSMEHEPPETAEVTTEETPQDAPREPEYFWARIENDGRRAILWWPDVEQIRLAVGDKSLPGVIQQDQDVTLGQLEAEHIQLINSPASRLLQWSQPVTFIRIGD